MIEEGDKDILSESRSLYTASRKTGISICALRNACEKTNRMITRRKHSPVKYEISWDGLCDKCFHTKKERKGVIRMVVVMIRAANG